jgi:hypothetical protein
VVEETHRRTRRQPATPHLAGAVVDGPARALQVCGRPHVIAQHGAGS